MKKYLFTAMTVALLVACGGSGEKKETGKEEEKQVEDITQNPDYQAGLAIVANPKNLCLTCHKIDEKLVGPPYRDVANKYENTEENVNMLAEKVKKGGVGVWGEVPMPPNDVISMEDARAAVKYILLLKK